ncbi:MAG: hypothetical protein IAG13_05425 [Deltaproteobacteria bacterium]|nr:hypothetical protein [Nannocystaceae bacterium]
MPKTIRTIVLLAALAPLTARADGMYEVSTGLPYDVEHPVDLVGGSGELYMRWVPLCDDGSGDHEWSRNPAAGIAPTCASDEYIRCIDGTRPTYYLDKARNLANSADITSDTWVFWFQGGGSCSDRDALGAGETCWDDYANPGETGEMGSTGNTRRIAGGGILDPNRAENEFKRSNRVQIKKCTYDRFTGAAELLSTPNGDGDDIDLYWHGRRTIAAVLSDLEDGAAYKHGGVDVVLPPLADAEGVLFSGHSGGSGGVIMNGDWMAEEVLAIAPTAEVRLLVDERFEPSLENEPGFDGGFTVPDDDDNGDGVIDIWDHIAPTTANPGTLPGGGAYHRGAYRPGGGVAAQQDQWNVSLDASCELALGAGDARCRNEFHVLANHVTTPFFVRQALRDAHQINGGYSFADDPTFRFTEAEYRARVFQQIDSFVEGHHNDSMAATGEAGIPAPTWALGVFASDTTVHAGDHDAFEFFDVKLCEVGVGTGPADAFSYHDALFRWLDSDTETIAVEDPAAFAGEYCNAAEPTCDCF